MESPIMRIVMLPFPSYGHLTPSLTLAKEISQRSNCTITIVSTPLNIRFLQSSSIFSSSSSSKIHFAEIPFSSCDHNLPPNVENTEDVPVDKFSLLVHALITTLPPHFLALVSKIVAEECDKNSLCIISDALYGWAVEIGKSLGIYSVTFCPSGAFGSAAYVSFWQNLPIRSSEIVQDEYELPGFPDEYRFKSSDLLPFVRAADGSDAWSRFFQGQLKLSLGSDGWLFNTVEEVEGLGLGLLRKCLKVPVWTIGPLLAPPRELSLTNSHDDRDENNSGSIWKKHGISSKQCIEWLDLHPQKSVVYVSFGSQISLTLPHMMELAKGLEDSGSPFIWVLRPPIGYNNNNSKVHFKSKEWLPEGFEERIGATNRGLMIHNWAPQLEILSHRSTSVFISHCGWNSAMESLSRGVPMITWPVAAEQVYNARVLVEEMGCACELSRGLQRPIKKEDVMRAVNMAIDEDGIGGKMKRKAIEISDKMRNAKRDEEGYKGSSIKALDDFNRCINCNKNFPRMSKLV